MGLPGSWERAPKGSGVLGCRMFLSCSLLCCQIAVSAAQGLFQRAQGRDYPRSWKQEREVLLSLFLVKLGCVQGRGSLRNGGSCMSSSIQGEGALDNSPCLGKVTALSCP